MPFNISATARLPTPTSRPAASTTASTRPLAGSMSTISSVCHTLAHTWPSDTLQLIQPGDWLAVAV